MKNFTNRILFSFSLFLVLCNFVFGQTDTINYGKELKWLSLSDTFYTAKELPKSLSKYLDGTSLKYFTKKRKMRRHWIRKHFSFIYFVVKSHDTMLVMTETMGGAHNCSLYWYKLGEKRYYKRFNYNCCWQSIRSIKELIKKINSNCFRDYGMPDEFFEIIQQN